MYHVVNQVFIDIVHNGFLPIPAAVLFLGDIEASLCILHEICCQDFVVEVKVRLHKAYGP